MCYLFIVVNNNLTILPVENTSLVSMQSLFRWLNSLVILLMQSNQNNDRFQYIPPIRRLILTKLLWTSILIN